MILQFRLSNSGLSFAMYPSSVVHTGVKSLGCEKSTAQPSPIHSWNRIFPSVVSAVKSGALLPMRRIMTSSSYGEPIWISIVRDPTVPHQSSITRLPCHPPRAKRM